MNGWLFPCCHILRHECFADACAIVKCHSSIKQLWKCIEVRDDEYEMFSTVRIYFEHTYSCTYCKYCTHTTCTLNADVVGRGTRCIVWEERKSYHLF